MKNSIPQDCPRCGSKTEWHERVNPFTTGIPLFGGRIRLSLIVTKGFRFRNVKYDCGQCGFTGEYRLS